MACVTWFLCVSTYAGWDHKWDLLVVEFAHVIWVTGGGFYSSGEGEAFKSDRSLSDCLEGETAGVRSKESNMAAKLGSC